MSTLSAAARAFRLWHTVRFLKPVQIYGRLWRHVYTPRPDPRPGPGIRPFNCEDWKHPAMRLPSMPDDMVFRFLSQTHALGDIGWDSPAIDKLWRYNQHYFDDLNAHRAEERSAWHRSLVGDWIAKNPPGEGTGWEPYPTSLRIVNWIKWALTGNALSPEAVKSLAVQARWLAKRLEWHLLGNHLLANAKALVFAGLFFEGPEAERWLSTGLSIYERELPEQILQDGGHFERSPMYHAIILEDLLDIHNLAGVFGSADLTGTLCLSETIDRMRQWLAIMTHPDGGLSFFNDAAFGIAASREDLENYAVRLGLPSGEEADASVHSLGASGYVRADIEDVSAIVDVAPIGPDYLPGHAHADTLSFELSFGNDRVIVNSGTSVYGISAQRHFERSTAAHSTIEVDGENSSEVWGGFRVARRARVHDLNIENIDGVISIDAAHDGYKRLGGEALHSRSWRFVAGKLVVVDRMHGRIESAVARFHLGSGCSLTANDNGLGGEILLSQERRIHWSTSAPARIESSSWHPQFGESIDTKMLVIDVPPDRLETSFSW